MSPKECEMPSTLGFGEFGPVVGSDAHLGCWVRALLLGRGEGAWPGDWVQERGWPTPRTVMC